MVRLSLILTLLAAHYILCWRPTFADEFPIVTGSTIVGENFGYPSGTPQVSPSPPGQLDFVFEASTYCKNLELTGYDNDTINGETYIGALAPIRLRYQKSENVTVEAGAVLGDNFGDDDRLDVTEPLLRLVLQPLPHNYFVAGTIIRTHWMHDAFYDDVYAFRENAEQGFQYRVDGQWLKQDAWLNWRVRETELRSEQFEIGNTTQLRWGGLWLDGQFHWSHVGGQKNLEDRVANNTNFLAGASYGFHMPRLRNAHLRTGVHYLGTTQTDDAVILDDPNGNGFEIRSTLDVFPTEHSFLRLFGSHYEGDGLTAWRGDPLYHADTYTQAGASLVLHLNDGLRVEMGLVAQNVNGTPMNTYQLLVVWGDVLPLFSRGTYPTDYPYLGSLDGLETEPVWSDRTRTPTDQARVKRLPSTESPVLAMGERLVRYQLESRSLPSVFPQFATFGRDDLPWGGPVTETMPASLDALAPSATRGVTRGPSSWESGELPRLPPPVVTTVDAEGASDGLWITSTPPPVACGFDACTAGCCEDAPAVWGITGARYFFSGTRTAPNGVDFDTCFSLDLDFSVWLWRRAGLYMYSESRFWTQRPGNGITNANQAIDFSKREYDLHGGPAWNYWRSFEARVFLYSYNNINRGTSPSKPWGYKDGLGLEHRFYLSPAYADLGTSRFNQARADFVSIGYFPSKGMITLSGDEFKPALFLRACVTTDLWNPICYGYLDVRFITEKPARARQLHSEFGIALKPFRFWEGVELRAGVEDIADFVDEEGADNFLTYLNLRTVF